MDIKIAWMAAKTSFESTEITPFFLAEIDKTTFPRVAWKLRTGGELQKVMGNSCFFSIRSKFSWQFYYVYLSR